MDHASEDRNFVNDAGGPRGMNSVLAQQILAELDKLLGSKSFVRSPRLSRFLRFTIQLMVSGRAAEIKEYLLGVEVFDRGSAYDPHLDPIVRVEAGRLRARLKQYYESEGKDDPIIIELPKGSYVPTFTTPTPPPSNVALVWSWIRAPYAWRTVIAVIIAGLTELVLSQLTVLSNRTGPRQERVATIRAARTAQTQRFEGLFSIGVLPFEDLSAKKDQEYLCSGITDTLTNALANMKGFRVAPYTTASMFTRQHEDLRKIGAQLRVDNVLEGSVRKAGRRLRVSVRVIRVADGLDIWSEMYEHGPMLAAKTMRHADLRYDALSVQDEISRAIVNSLRIDVIGAPRTTNQLVSAGPLNYEVGSPAKRNPTLWNDQGGIEAAKSMKYFEQAVSEGPNFALAYTALARSYILLGTWNSTPPGEAMPKAEAAAMKALESGDLAEAHTVLGFVKSVYDWDWQGAEIEYKYALELDPDNPYTHRWYALTFLASTGRLNEALREVKQALELDPGSTVIRCTEAGLLLRSGKYEQAIEQCRKTLASNQNNCWAYRDLALALEGKSRFVDAVAALQHAEELSHGNPAIIAALGHAYALSGRKHDAVNMIDDLKRLSNRRYVSPYHIASIYAGLGEPDEAFNWLNKAFEDRSALLNGVKVDPLFSSLRTQPRFIALLGKMGLEN